MTLAFAWIAVLALIGLLATVHTHRPEAFARTAASCAALWATVGLLAVLHTWGPS